MSLIWMTEVPQMLAQHLFITGSARLNTAISSAVRSPWSSFCGTDTKLPAEAHQERQRSGFKTLSEALSWVVAHSQKSAL
jgi:hypothetical protein